MGSLLNFRSGQIYAPYVKRPGLRNLVSSGGGVTPTQSYSFLSSLSGDFNFSRASLATYWNSSGVLSSATTNAPRFDYNPTTLVAKGLLLEPQTTNNCFSSTNVSQFSNNGAQNTANAGVAPDGTTTATLMADISGNFGDWGVYQGTYLGAGNQYTQSCYVKAGSSPSRYCWLSFGFDNPDWVSAIFDLQNGVVASTGQNGAGVFLSAFIQQCPNGWYRIGATAQSTIDGFSLNLGVCSSGSASNMGSYGNVGTTGNGSSIYAWGYQIEANPFPTSFIYTTQNTSATRATDILYSSSVSYLNDPAGTLMVDCIPGTNLQTDYPWICSYSDSGNQNQFGFYTINTGSAALIQVKLQAGGTDELDTTIVGSEVAGTEYKLGLAYSSAGASYTYNGNTPNTYGALTPPSGISQLYLGSQYSGGGDNWFGWLRALKYWNSKLTNSQLQTVTT